MLDIIGFWGVVTLLTAMFIAPLLFWLAPPLIKHFVGTITGDKSQAKCISDKVIYWGYSSSFGSYVEVLGLKMWEGFGVLISIIGVCMWVLVGLVTVLPIKVHDPDSLPLFTSYVDFIAQTSTVIAPYAGEVSFFVLIYLFSILIGRKGYKMYQKVEQVLEKVNEHK